MKNIEFVVKDIIMEALKDRSLEIRNDTDLILDLGMDSISLITVIIKIENYFDFNFPEESINEMVISNFSTLIKIIKQNIIIKEVKK